jgi:polysaccharide chain length determinant protein (PEP-CTERM system associated)
LEDSLNSQLPTDDLNPQSAAGGLLLKEYWDLALRRKWWIALVGIAVFVGATVVALRAPNVYKSETVILVDPQKVPDSYVPTTVSSTVADRLSTIRQLAMSPTRLTKLIQTLKLDQRPGASHDVQRLIQTMQKSIVIDVGEGGGQRLSSFKISYFSTNPQDAAAVANNLAAMVIHDNLQARAQQFTGTADFLDNELKNVKQQLEDKEKEVGRVKSQNVTDLPESKQYHLEALNGLRNQLRVSQDRVSQLRQSKAYLQSAMNVTAPTVDLDSSASSGSVSPYQTQIQKLEAKLSDLQTRYGPSYPDVRKLEAEIADLKKRGVQDSPASAERQETPSEIVRRPAPVRNPVLESELNKIDEQIATENKLQAQLQPQIDFHLSKLERVPVFEQKLSDLMRDYDTLNAHYNQLLAKKLSAEMAKQLDVEQQGERFLILDAAIVPTRPYGPNRPLIMLAGLFGGLLGGFVLAMVVEMTDQSVRNEREASQILGKGVLAGVPLILLPQERRERWLRAVGMIAGTAIGAAVLTLGLTYILELVA